MAVLDFNADEKYRAYHILACLNRSFRNIFNNLGELKETGVLNKKQLNTLRGISQELQADINFHALEILQETEEEDWGRFGKARLDRDKGASVVPGKKQ
jgi:hypothetical protein